MNILKKVVFLLLIIALKSGCNGIEGELLFTEEDPMKGFNFPYFLFIPDNMKSVNDQFLIVEPNNSGFVSDNLEKHIEKAERTATIDFYLGNYISQNLKFPLLVPVFPRSESSWKIYSHALDRDVILQQGNELERIDLQLIAMIEDAKHKLNEMGYRINDKIIISGFSASGSFANRFSLIHPGKVLLTIAGGLNGLVMLPYAELNGKKLNYPLGISDYHEVFGKPFDSASFKELPQYLFMGELDNNDAIPYEDGYDEEEREIVYKLLGQEMLPKRWNNCIRLYMDADVNARFKTYIGVGHEQPEEVKKDILDYINKSIKSN